MLLREVIALKEQTSCKKCGSCCKQGGPALHQKDLKLLQDNKIPRSSLITIRRGELTQNPISGAVQPASVELVKIIGTGREWQCCYFDEEQGCSIYANRPQACVVLKCWDTAEILDLVEKETVSRFDILSADDAMLSIIKEYERICPFPDMLHIKENRQMLSTEFKGDIEKLVNDDLRFRTKVTGEYNLTLNDELFYFGRPIFQLLQALGVTPYESHTGVSLKW